MPAPVLQFKRGAFANLPGLRTGEPGFTTDKYDLYVGLTSSTATNKFFGSARYWTRETASTAAGLNFVENTTGTDYITIKAPDSVSGIGTYTLPDTNTIVDGYFLKVSAGGQLSWSNAASFINAALSGITTISGSLNNTASTTNSGITTFTNTTDNTLGNSNTGAVQIDGGVGIDKNLTVGANLHVVNDITTSATTFNLVNTTATNVNFAGTATALVMGAATGITTVNNNLTVAGDIRINGNDIQSSTATALTLNGSDVTAANNLTVTGNLYVNGSTTQVNTTALTVEDRTIDLGIVNGATPASATTWDLGVLFNYYTAGSAKKSAVIWEHADSRFKFASVLSSDTDGTTVDTPQLTVTTFSPIEISELWINNTCTGGAQQVIGCIGAELNLQNITIDAGTF